MIVQYPIITDDRCIPSPRLPSLDTRLGTSTRESLPITCNEGNGEMPHVNIPAPNDNERPVQVCGRDILVPASDDAVPSHVALTMYIDKPLKHHKGPSRDTTQKPAIDSTRS